MRTYKLREKFDASEAKDILSEAEDLLNQSIEALENFKHIVSYEDNRLARETEYYIIRHLKDWVNNDRQPGSIPSLSKGLDDLNPSFEE